MQVTFQEQLQQVYQEVSAGLVEWIPRLLALIALVIVGLIVARVAERVLAAFLKRVRFEALMQKAGVDRALQKLGVRRSINEFIPRLFYYLLLFLIARTVADALNLTAVSSAIATVMAYLPHLIGALLILIIGGVAARITRRAVEDMASGGGFTYAAGIARATSGMVLFVFGVMALSQLQIETVMIRWAAIALLAGSVATFAISLGLGSREITRNMLAGLYARNVFKPGMTLEIEGRRGVLSAITPTQTVLLTEDKIVSFANVRFLEVITESDREDD